MAIKENRTVMKSTLITPSTNKLLALLKQHNLSLGDLIEWAAPLKLTEANENCPLISSLVMCNLYERKETHYLKENESMMHPASTKREIHGPAIVKIERFADGGINVRVEEWNTGVEIDIGNL